MPIVEAARERSAQERLAQINKDIEAVERKKLITVIVPGASDTVLYIQPLDLRGKDPEEDLEVEEWIVTDTDFSGGFANHKRTKQMTGVFKKRGPMGPFGPTYKINTDTQDGKREWEALKRVIEQHTSRHEKVPEPISYHQEVNDLGMRDLKSISIEKGDVPTAVLENYAPLAKLYAERDELLVKLGKAPVAAPANDEEAAMAVAAGVVFQCPDLECDFVAKNPLGLAQHRGRNHKNDSKEK